MKASKVASIVSLMMFMAAFKVNAGGLYLYEIATEDLGLAGAGIAARAQDASTVVSNPAGMIHLEGNQLTVGGQLLYGNLDYDVQDERLKDGGNAVGALPSASLFYSHSVNERLRLGVGLYGNFGLSLDFNDDWAGRNLVKDSTMMGITIQPAMAYSLNSEWALGMGVGINYGIFSLTRDRANGTGEIEQNDHDWAANLRLGILYTPSEQTRVGLTYTSAVKYDFNINATGNLAISGAEWQIPINTSVNAPQQVMLSGFQQLNTKWALLGNLGWQDWSNFSQMDTTIGNKQVASMLHLQDTWHGAAGVQYQISQMTRINTGFAYDTSMYQDQNNTSFLMPAGDTWRFGIGVQQVLNTTSSIGAAFEYLMSEDANVSSPAVLAGGYHDPNMYFFAVNYNRRF